MKLNFIGRITGAVTVAAVALWAGCSNDANTVQTDATGACPSTQTLCSDECSDLTRDPSNCGQCGTACAKGEVCNMGACTVACGAQLSDCSGSCTNTATDLANCGACGTACKTGEVCSNGACALTCQDGLKECSSSCVNTKTDNANCGACGTKCAAGELCSNGACAANCQAELTACAGACTSLRNDAANCGACGTKCAAGELCTDGTCTLSCQDGLTNCGGTCVDVMSNKANCGGCGSACAAGDVCNAGSCSLNCAASATNCGGTCVDTQTDGMNCGGCDSPCSAGQTCQAGTCLANCGAGLTDCNGACVNEASDPQNCGSCGTSCAANEYCLAGSCTATCPAPNTQCGLACTNVANDAANCGGCGNLCDAGMACVAGSCVGTVCVPGAAVDCYTGAPASLDHGTCHVGTKTCNGDGTAFSACSGDTLPAAQLCSAADVDTDCDGIKPTVLYTENFDTGGESWTVDGEWSIGALPANPSSCQVGTNPTEDHSAGADNGVAGTDLGDCAYNTPAPRDVGCLTSPAIDISGAVGRTYFSFWRDSGADYYGDIMPETLAFSTDDGANWTENFHNTSSISDNTWTFQTFDVTAHKSTTFRARFCMRVNDSIAYTATGWKIDDVSISTGESCQ
jgi:hypothetical protein